MLNGTSGTWSISDLTATGTGGAAFDANAAGTVNFAGTNSLTGSGASAFKNTGATTYSGTISTTSSSGGAANGIEVGRIRLDHLQRGDAGRNHEQRYPGRRRKRATA